MAYATNSLGNYSGTIVVSPIRPFGPSSGIATVFSNEIKGAHHTYETIAERDAVDLNRRDWGMLSTVYNDPTLTNNKTYILKYGFVDTNLANNDNWIEFGSTNGDWIDSVQVVSNTPAPLVDGYRYLVSSGGLGDFSGQDGKIAQYSSLGLTFSFIEPSNGTSLRYDSEPNVIYKYHGTFSSGKWVKEYLNQVRYLTAYSLNGMSYSATSSQSPIINYSDAIFYVNFNMTSSGTVSLDIDSVSFVDVKKLQNNSLSYIGANEIIPGIQYQLIYNSGSFQTTLPSSTTTTIGAAEDGDYTDGLYTDFTTTTPIGIAVDRFNEVLKYLAPPIGPTLSSWSATGSFVNGGISFDDTVGGFVGASSSPYGAVAKGGTFSSLDNYYRLGIMSKVSQPLTGNAYYQDISGRLNINAAYLYAYATYSFGYADTGTISLILNGVTVSSVGLTNSAAIDSTLAGATSGISLSAATSSMFANGGVFPPFQNRTGTYLIKKDHSAIVDGYNYFIARHDLPSSSFVLSRFEFVADSSTASIVPVTRQVSSVNAVNKKFISGIEYWNTPIQFEYNVVLQNIVSNTFNQSPSAMLFRDVSTQSSSATNSVTGNVTRNSSNNFPAGLPIGQIFNVVNPGAQFYTQSIVPPPGFVPSSQLSFSVTYSVASHVRRINDAVGFAVDVQRTVQGTFSGATSLGTSVPVTGWFIDTLSNESSQMSEFFADETYRLINGNQKFGTYTSIASALAGTWSSSASLINGVNHNNGLQVINGSLVYPRFNFNTAGTSVTNPNFGLGTSRDYSVASGFLTGFGTSLLSPPTNYRTYTRIFYSPARKTTWVLTINANSTNYIQADLPLNSNMNVWLEIKMPGVTGWLDAKKTFSRNLNDGAGGYTSIFAVPGGMRFWVTSGTTSSNYLLLRITAGPDWRGNINSIIVT